MSRLAPLVIVALLIASTVGAIAVVDPPMPGVDRSSSPPEPERVPGPGPAVIGSGFTSFASSSEFQTYVNRSQRRYGTEDRTAGPEGDAGFDGVNLITSPDPATSDRVAVNESYVYHAPRAEFDPGMTDADTSVLHVSPTARSDRVATVDQTGSLLRLENALVVVDQGTIAGYDVSTPAAPSRVWNQSIPGQVVTVREHRGSVLLVVARDATADPCPVEPLDGASVPCDDIYRPPDPAPADTTYSVVRLDPASGRIQGAIGVVGSERANVHAASDAVYLTVADPIPRGALLLDFLLTEARPLLPVDVAGELERIRGAELSDDETYKRASQVLDEWLSSQSATERGVLYNRLGVRYRSYVAANREDLQRTHVVGVHANRLEITASGSVTGLPRDRLAVDRHAGYLQVATDFRLPPLRWGRVNTSVDVHTLNLNLDVVGSTVATRRPVSASRFVGEAGFLVTDRQGQSLRVVNLSDPTNPRPAGWVPLTDDSRAVLPLSADRVLRLDGDGRLRATVFDISTTDRPRSVARRTLDTSPAATFPEDGVFHDANRGAVFISTEDGGKVLSTADLSTLATVEVQGARRVTSVGDHLYIFGRRSIVIVDERSWSVVTRIGR